METNQNVKASPSLGFVDAVKICFQKYATFKGRARRSEFWWFYSISIVLSTAMTWLTKWKMGLVAELQTKAFDVTLSGGNTAELYARAESADTIFYTGMVIIGILYLAILLPLIAAQVRRLHDVGKSGSFMFFYFLCGIGGLIPFILCLQDGQPTANQYGESPKYKAQAIPTPGQ